MLVLAHAGHWLVNVLYVLPLAGIAIAMGISWLRERRAQKSAAEEPTVQSERPDRRR